MEYVNDTLLMAALAEDRQGAFAALLEKYMPMVSRTTYRILCDRKDSEKVTEDVFLSLWRSAPDYDGEVPLPVWIYATVFRMCRRYMLMHSILDPFSISVLPYETSAPAALSAQEDYITKETWEIFCRASRNLSYRQRAVFVLHEMEGLSIKDVEMATGIKAEQLEECLHQAKVKLKIELGKYGKIK